MPLMKVMAKDSCFIARDITNEKGVQTGARIEFVHDKDDRHHPGRPAVSLEISPTDPENKLLVRIYDYNSSMPIEERAIDIRAIINPDNKVAKRLKATNIIWDIDDEEDDENLSLPTEIEIPEGMTDDDEISDYISDETGFCHKGFTLTEI